MDSAGIPWYSTGTVNVTQGSSNVAGVGTNWVNAGLKVGDIFTIDKSRLYQITAINSNTSLSLQEAYQGATGSAQVYFVIRNFAGTMQAQIAAQVSELVNKYETYIDTELKQITGPAGPTSFPYRGTWTTGRSYNGLDVVLYGNQLYMALYGHTSTSANAPGATGTAWTPLSVSVSGDIITTNFGTGPGFHNSIFRGANLGSSVTAAQWAAIGNGTFDGLFIGDYWTINNIVWRIADFDYYFNSGSQPCTQHHAVIVPGDALYQARMNATNTTQGGYTGSEMYTTNLEQAKTLVNAAFGSTHVLVHKEWLSNAVTDGNESGGTWFDSTVELMSEQMVYGGIIYKSGVSLGQGVYARSSISYKQLSIFRYIKPGLNTRKWIWLRDVVTGGFFSLIAGSGFASYSNASYADGGVLPYFAICAD